MSEKQQVYCNQPNHEANVIIGFCISKECKEKNKVLCAKCLLQSHKNHTESIRFLQDISQKESASPDTQQQQQTDDTEQLLKKSNQIVKQIQVQFDAIKKQVNKEFSSVKKEITKNIIKKTKAVSVNLNKQEKMYITAFNEAYYHQIIIDFLLKKITQDQFNVKLNQVVTQRDKLLRNFEDGKEKKDDKKKEDKKEEKEDEEKQSKKKDEQVIDFSGIQTILREGQQKIKDITNLYRKGTYIPQMLTYDEVINEKESGKNEVRNFSFSVKKTKLQEGFVVFNEALHDEKVYEFSFSATHYDREEEGEANRQEDEQQIRDNLRAQFGGGDGRFVHPQNQAHIDNLRKIRRQNLAIGLINQKANFKQQVKIVENSINEINSAPQQAYFGQTFGSKNSGDVIFWDFIQARQYLDINQGNLGFYYDTEKQSDNNYTQLVQQKINGQHDEYQYTVIVLPKSKFMLIREEQTGYLRSLPFRKFDDVLPFVASRKNNIDLQIGEIKTFDLQEWEESHKDHPNFRYEQFFARKDEDGEEEEEQNQYMNNGFLPEDEEEW